MKLNKKGFTLIELVIVIIIIAILAAVAIPRFQDLAGHAREASERATAVAVRQAITIYRAHNELGGIIPVLPLELDAVAAGTDASPANPFFVEVMEVGGGITSGWRKVTTGAGEEGRYEGPTHTITNPAIFVYQREDGSFQRLP